MVAHDTGYSVQLSSAKKQKACFAGVNFPASKRGERPAIVDDSIEANPLRMAETKELMALVNECTRKHPAECKDLKFVIMKYVQGKPIKAVASAMKTSPERAKSRLTQTLNFLETYIRGQEHQA